jgi:rubrerythrin
MPAKRSDTVEDKRLSELINMAIKREEEAYAFYTNLCEKVEDQNVKDTVEWIAGEEKKHKEFLIRYRDGKYGSTNLRLSDVVYYKIAEHQQEPEIETGMGSEEVYLVASHRELRSFKFYTELAELHPEGETKIMLSRMANEELKHKEKMEYLYTNTAYPQTSGG